MGALNPQSEIVVANLPFAFKACKAVTGQREKWKIIGTDGLRLREVKVTEETLFRN